MKTYRFKIDGRNGFIKANNIGDAVTTLKSKYNLDNCISFQVCSDLDVGDFRFDIENNLVEFTKGEFK